MESALLLDDDDDDVDDDDDDIYSSWVSTRWQRSVELCKNRKGVAIYKRYKNTEYTKQKTIIQNKKTKHKKNIKKRNSRN